ncbi:MAG: YqgE/AlgH family protein [Bacteroidia bacterium]
MQLKISHKQFKPYKGCILLSEPFLLDPNFRKTAVLLTEHNDEGSVGFVINRPLNLFTDDLLPDTLLYNFPVFYGGPVEKNTLHFIHKNNKEFTEARQITDDIFWGGTLQEVNDIISANPDKCNDFKFFMGYSGWSSGQLMDEIDMKSWWVVKALADDVFSDDLEDMWKNLVKKLGSNYAYMANAPEDYLFN